MKNFIHATINAGIDDQTPRHDVMEIRATNMMTTYLSLLVLPLVVYSKIEFPTESYWLQLLGMVALYGLSPVFNHLRHHNVARSFSVYAGAVAVFWGTWVFGFETGIQFLFFINVVNAFMSFHFAHKWKVTVIVLSILLIYLLSWYNYEINGPQLKLNQEQTKQWSLFFWIIGFAALLIYSYFSIQVVRGKSRILLQHQTTLENQNEALTKANKELDYFFYAVSHDLRSPLTSVLGLIELMKMENDPTQINNYLSLQESSIKKMNDFIFDIIHIAKNARQELEVDSISFNSIIQDIIAQHEFNDDSQQIEKIVTVDQKNEFFGDATRLKIVLNNLISNAIHYSNLTQEKSIIKISVVTNLNEAIIKIWDNGIGIPKEFQQKVFDMFFRGNNEKPGTGLGLYMVHEIIHKMNGTIELKSELNHFTEFILHIPQKK